MELAERQLGQEDARESDNNHSRPGCCGVKSLRMWTTFKGAGLMAIMACFAGAAAYVIYVASHLDGPGPPPPSKPSVNSSAF
eukprot:scaffold151529_cov31-Prasinocladus_malaysianus.AAC.1